MNLPVVEVKAASLTYRLPRHQIRSIRSLISNPLRQVTFESWQALRDVDFSLKNGDVLAVIGRNGAGKSSLLKLLAKVMPPSQGQVVVRGNVAPLIELGAGFNFELTAPENIVLYGALLGRHPKVMASRVEEIASWAGILGHMNVPLRTFSSGMTARLAFSIATDTTPDLLLVDEVLAVGDEEFRTKSRQRSRSLISSGAAVVLVTHDLEAAKEWAPRTIWLEKGRVVALGPTQEVVSQYLGSL